VHGRHLGFPQYDLVGAALPSCQIATGDSPASTDRIDVFGLTVEEVFLREGEETEGSKE
jgi:hypothetical protein